MRPWREAASRFASLWWESGKAWGPVSLPEGVPGYCIYLAVCCSVSSGRVCVVAKGLPADFYKSRTFFFVFFGGGVLSIGFGTAQEISLFFFSGIDSSINHTHSAHKAHFTIHTNKRPDRTTVRKRRSLSASSGTLLPPRDTSHLH